MHDLPARHRRAFPTARALIFLSGGLLCQSALATVHYVNGSSGSDSNDGSSPAKALATIGKAAGNCEPGDRIVVAKGVYYGPIDLNLKGTAAQPITLEAEDRARNAVIITNADRAIREGRSPWESVPDAPGIYRTPLSGGTARVLYSGTDLQPYFSLDDLKSFTTKDGQPGPAHGYFYDQQARQLYLRLHASGKYGSANPTDHIVSASPRSGGGSAGTSPNGPEFYNLGLLERGDTHVIIDGFTFETPGCAGVYTNGHYVTVRNSWFVGCRVGVSGRRESAKPAETSNHITVEYCDYSQYPAFDDMMEVMKERHPAPGAPKYPLYWWSRKGGGTGNPLTYELGICGLVGSDWTLAHNRIHDAFEGLSTWCSRWSKGLRIHDNLFERLVDNAIEMEDHSEDMRIWRNHFINTTEPLSWQPLGGTPWPGPVYVYENVIRNDAEFNQSIIDHAGHIPGWFKAGAAEGNWTAAWNRDHMQDVPKNSVRAPGDGIVVFNNTVVYPGGRFLTITQPAARRFENFHFINNLVVAQTFIGKPGYRAPDMDFRNNVWIPSPGPDDNSGEIFAGTGGRVLAPLSQTSPTPLVLLDLGKTSANPAGIPVPEAAAVLANGDRTDHIGATMNGNDWTPPIAGPQPQK